MQIKCVEIQNSKKLRCSLISWSASATQLAPRVPFLRTARQIIGRFGGIRDLRCRESALHHRFQAHRQNCDRQSYRSALENRSSNRNPSCEGAG